MTGPVAALNWVELFVGLLALLAAGYGSGVAVLGSIKNGIIFKYVIEPRQKAKRAHEQVDDVESKVDDLDEKVEEVAGRVELQTDAVIAVGESLNNGEDFDVDKFESLANDRSVNRLLRDDD